MSVRFVGHFAFAGLGSDSWNQYGAVFIVLFCGTIHRLMDVQIDTDHQTERHPVRNKHARKIITVLPDAGHRCMHDALQRVRCPKTGRRRPPSSAPGILNGNRRRYMVVRVILCVSQHISAGYRRPYSARLGAIRRFRPG